MRVRDTCQNMRECIKRYAKDMQKICIVSVSKDMHPHTHPHPILSRTHQGREGMFILIP